MLWIPSKIRREAEILGSLSGFQRRCISCKAFPDSAYSAAIFARRFPHLRRDLLTNAPKRDPVAIGLNQDRIRTVDEVKGAPSRRSIRRHRPGETPVVAGAEAPAKVLVRRWHENQILIRRSREAPIRRGDHRVDVILLGALHAGVTDAIGPAERNTGHACDRRESQERRIRQDERCACASLKAIAESFCDGSISNSPIDGI